MKHIDLSNLALLELPAVAAQTPVLLKRHGRPIQVGRVAFGVVDQLEDDRGVPAVLLDQLSLGVSEQQVAAHPDQRVRLVLDYLGGSPQAFLRVLKPTTFKRGTGVTGPFFVLTMGTAGEIPHVGNANFKIEVRWAPPGAPAVLAGSLAPADVSIAGINLYGDFLTPGLFTTWGFVINPIFGTATLPIPIPNDPMLVGLISYWQWFVMDSASPLPLGVSYTHGLGVIIIE